MHKSKSDLDSLNGDIPDLNEEEAVRPIENLEKHFEDQGIDIFAVADGLHFEDDEFKAKRRQKRESFANFDKNCMALSDKLRDFNYAVKGTYGDKFGSQHMDRDMNDPLNTDAIKVFRNQLVNLHYNIDVDKEHNIVIKSKDGSKRKSKKKEKNIHQLKTEFEQLYKYIEVNNMVHDTKVILANCKRNQTDPGKKLSFLNPVEVRDGISYVMKHVYQQ